MEDLLISTSDDKFSVCVPRLILSAFRLLLVFSFFPFVLGRNALRFLVDETVCTTTWPLGGLYTLRGHENVHEDRLEIQKPRLGSRGSCGAA
jgi:hypothetical protein